MRVQFSYFSTFFFTYSTLNPADLSTENFFLQRKMLIEPFVNHISKNILRLLKTTHTLNLSQHFNGILKCKTVHVIYTEHLKVHKIFLFLIERKTPAGICEASQEKQGSCICKKALLWELDSAVDALCILGGTEKGLITGIQVKGAKGYPFSRYASNWSWSTNHCEALKKKK